MKGAPLLMSGQQTLTRTVPGKVTHGSLSTGRLSHPDSPRTKCLMTIGLDVLKLWKSVCRGQRPASCKRGEASSLALLTASGVCTHWGLTARSPRLVSLLSGTQFCPGNSYFSLGLTFSGAYLDVTVFEETSRRFLL